MVEAEYAKGVLRELAPHIAQLDEFTDEMKALQSRASQAVKETLEKKATTDI